MSAAYSRTLPRLLLQSVTQHLNLVSHLTLKACGHHLRLVSRSDPNVSLRARFASNPRSRDAMQRSLFVPFIKQVKGLVTSFICTSPRSKIPPTATSPPVTLFSPYTSAYSSLTFNLRSPSTYALPQPTLSLNLRSPSTYALPQPTLSLNLRSPSTYAHSQLSWHHHLFAQSSCLTLSTLTTSKYPSARATFAPSAEAVRQFRLSPYPPPPLQTRRGRQLLPGLDSPPAREMSLSAS
jgi:hypothetical protein